MPPRISSEASPSSGSLTFNRNHESGAAKSAKCHSCHSMGSQTLHGRSVPPLCLCPNPPKKHNKPIQQKETKPLKTSQINICVVLEIAYVEL